jgi:hypothetical protein
MTRTGGLITIWGSGRDTHAAIDATMRRRSNQGLGRRERTSATVLKVKRPLRRRPADANDVALDRERRTVQPERGERGMLGDALGVMRDDRE